MALSLSEITLCLTLGCSLHSLAALAFRFQEVFKSSTTPLASVGLIMTVPAILGVIVKILFLFDVVVAFSGVHNIIG